MKTQLVILNDKTIIVSDEDVKGDDNVLDGNKTYIAITDGCSVGRIGHGGASLLYFKNPKKIIAGLPDLPSIDFNGLEEQLSNKFTIKNLVFMYNMGISDCRTYLDSADRMNKHIQSITEPKFDIEIEWEYKDMVGNWYKLNEVTQLSVDRFDLPVRPRIKNNSIKILKKL